MAVMNRANFGALLEPGLNALFGLEYDRYDNQCEVLFEQETSERAFEEEQLLVGFGAAPVKTEGAAIEYDAAYEGWQARYTHVTIALAFSITEEAVEDNLYGSLSKRYSKALARAMHHTKETRGANIFNNGFNAAFTGGDGVPLFSAAHPLAEAANQSNIPTTSSDLNEASLEQAFIDISNWVDDRGIPIAVGAESLHIPAELVFTAERLLKTTLRVGTADNDINAIKNMGMLPGGYHINNRFTDPDAWFIKTDCPDGAKFFRRAALRNGMEGDFDTGNMRYKARERYSFGWTDWRGYYGSSGA